MTEWLKLREPAEGILRLEVVRPLRQGPDLAVLEALDAALAEALARQELRAILLAMEGAALVDVQEARGTQAVSTLGRICARCDDASIPIVAELTGTVTGGAAALAIAAHYRVALSDAALAWPDVTRGLPPSAGCTQRLPRIVGAGPALQIMLAGQAVPADRAQRIGLLDAVVPEDLPAAALWYAEALCAEEAGPRPASARPAPDFVALQAAVARRRKALDGDDPVLAPARIVDCVEAAALLPYEAGLAFEAAAVEECAATPAAQALAALEKAERRVRLQARGWAARARKVTRVGIWGTGTSAAALATGLLGAGSAVRLAARDQERLRAGVAAVDGQLEAALQAGRLSAAGQQALWARFSGGTGISSLGDCDLVLEAGAGAWAGRAQDLAALSAALPQGAILAATGALASGPALVRAGRRPADTLWLHLPDLVPGCRLAEAVVTRATAPETLATVATLIRRTGRIALRAQDESPLLAILMGALEAADTLVEEGASPYDVDAALTEWGFARGIYRMADRLGLETVLALRARLPEGEDPMRRPILVPGQLVAEGRSGRAAGRGYYRYPGSAPDGQPDPAVAAILASVREVLGLQPREIGAREICETVLAGMAQAGAGLLRRGVVAHPGDIDLGAVLGLGVARWRGGPMQAADQGGMLALRAALKRLAARTPRAATWTPDPLILDLFKTGRSFGDLPDGSGAADGGVSSG